MCVCVGRMWHNMCFLPEQFNLLLCACVVRARAKEREKLSRSEKQLNRTFGEMMKCERH